MQLDDGAGNICQTLVHGERVLHPEPLQGGGARPHARRHPPGHGRARQMLIATS